MILLANPPRVLTRPEAMFVHIVQNLTFKKHKLSAFDLVVIDIFSIVYDLKIKDRNSDIQGTYEEMERLVSVACDKLPRDLLMDIYVATDLDRANEAARIFRRKANEAQEPIEEPTRAIVLETGLLLLHELYRKTPVAHIIPTQDAYPRSALA